MTLYQSRKDVVNEKKVIKCLHAHTGTGFLELPGVTSAADWAVHENGKLKALVEVKNRTNALNTYSTYMIDKDKIDTLYNVSESLQLNGVLAVGFTDCVGFAFASTVIAESEVGTGGRTDRNDANDIDTVYYFPVEHFKRLDWNTND